MPKLKVLSGKETCAILEKHGFVKVRQKGSHIIMRRELEYEDSVTVPVPNHRELDKGTLNGIIRQSGINKNAFLC
ncbi:MAG: type II toxin-antitoxin system HicA family toxin [bacterium]